MVVVGPCGVALNLTAARWAGVCVERVNMVPFVRSLGNAAACIRLLGTLGLGQKHTWYRQKHVWYRACLFVCSPKGGSSYPLYNIYTVASLIQCCCFYTATASLCTSLNARSYVFLMDPWWNPAVEQQAQDR